MASKRDQLQSYQFLLQRMMHALVLRDTDPEQPPFRRGVVAMVAGVIVAALALAAVGVFSQLSPGGDKTWRDGQSVIVEKETGTPYVYVNGVLYPMANYTSAMLAMKQHASSVLVSQKSLLGVPRGPLVGIAGAPDSLPSSGRLLSGAWSLCARPTTDAAGNAVIQSELLVGHQPSGVRPVGNAGLLVITSGGARYLIWHGYRHAISQPGTVSAALALDSAPWLPVPTAWLDLIPSGPALGPIPVPGAGGPSRVLTPGRVGALYVVQTSTGQGQYYLLLRDELLPITPMQYDIQRSYSETGKAYPGVVPSALALDPAAAAIAVSRTAAPTPLEANALPTMLPAFTHFRSASNAVCALFGDGAFVPRLVIAPALPAAPPAAVTRGRSSSGLPLVNDVVVPAGYGAVVESMAAPGQPAGSGALSFVSDLGRRYQLASRDVLSLLGYDQAPIVRLPADLVSRIPAGQPLDPAAALRPIGP